MTTFEELKYSLRLFDIPCSRCTCFKKNLNEIEEFLNKIDKNNIVIDIDWDNKRAFVCVPKTKREEEVNEAILEEFDKDAVGLIVYYRHLNIRGYVEKGNFIHIVIGRLHYNDDVINVYKFAMSLLLSIIDRKSVPLNVGDVVKANGVLYLPITLAHLVKIHSQLAQSAHT